MSGQHQVLISVAPVQATPHPIIPAEIAEDVFRCYQAGAAMVHLHVRDENGGLTPDPTLLNETLRRIRDLCDIVIEVSTGGVSNLNIEERCVPCHEDLVEAVSLNVGSVNLGKAVYQNPIQDVEYCVQSLMAGHKVPEIEVFELGMIHTVRQLQDKFGLPDPLLFALVFGHEGEMPATRAALDHMLSFLNVTFADKEVRPLWGYTQSARKDWDMMRYALELGADSIRVGFEDSDYLDADTRVETNAPIVQRAADLVRATGARPMTAAEARVCLRIGK